MEQNALSKEDIKAKAMRFVNDVNLYSVIIICSKCGSTNIDKKSLTEIECKNCFNNMNFSTEFGIIPNNGFKNPQDITDMLSEVEKELTRTKR